MSYTPTTWVDGVTKLDPTNMNHLELGVQATAVVADAATAAIAANAPSPAVLQSITYANYTPTWTASGTAPAIGNGLSIGRYMQVGKLVHAFGYLQFGSTSTFGTGVYSIALPVTASANSITAATGSGYAQHSATMLVPAYFVRGGGLSFGIFYGATYLGTSTQGGQLAPWTWATGDQIYWSIVYEAA